MALENFVLWSAKVLTLGRIPGNRMKQMSPERVSSAVIATRTERSREKSVGAGALSSFSLRQRPEQTGAGDFTE